MSPEDIITEAAKVFAEKAYDDLAQPAKGVLQSTYDDLLKPIFQEVGGTFGTIFGLINNVLLYMPKKWVMKNKAELKKLAAELESELNGIKVENQQEAPLFVAMACVDGIAANLDEGNENIISMYLTLLTRACDRSTVYSSHPSFIEVIKQMSPIDYAVFDAFCKNYDHLAKQKMSALTPQIEIEYARKHEKIAMGWLPEWITELDIPEYSLFDISFSLTQLLRLGLIKNTGKAVPKTFNKLEQRQDWNEVKRFCSMFSAISDGCPTNLKYYKSSFQITEYGLYFANSCLNDAKNPPEVINRNLNRISRVISTRESITKRLISESTRPCKD